MVPAINYENVFLSKENQELYQWMKQQPQDKIFFELPARYEDNIDYVYNSSLHFKKITNGYGGYEPFEYRELIDKTAEFGFKKHPFYLKN